MHIFPSLTHPNSLFFFGLGMCAHRVTHKMQYLNFIKKTLLAHWGLTYITTYYWLKLNADGAPVASLSDSRNRTYEPVVRVFCYCCCCCLLLSFLVSLFSFSIIFSLLFSRSFLYRFISFSLHFISPFSLLFFIYFYYYASHLLFWSGDCVNGCAARSSATRAGR